MIKIPKHFMRVEKSTNAPCGFYLKETDELRYKYVSMSEFCMWDDREEEKKVEFLNQQKLKKEKGFS